MQFTKQDVNHLKNLLRALNKGQYTLDAEEIMAFSEMVKWAVALTKIAEAQVLEEERKAKQPLVPVPIESPVKEEPKPKHPRKRKEPEPKKEE